MFSNLADWVDLSSPGVLDQLFDFMIFKPEIGCEDANFQQQVLRYFRILQWHVIVAP
jgi:hypothetical protein